MHNHVLNFDNLGSFGYFLQEILTHGLRISCERALEECAQLVEDTAISEFGSQQSGAGPFPSWPPLASETIDRKIRGGYAVPNDLVREGNLKNSISHYVDKSEPAAYIGSNDHVMVYQELGTSRIPPRSVLGIALWRNIDRIIAHFGNFVGIMDGSSSKNTNAQPMGYHTIF